MTYMRVVTYIGGMADRPPGTRPASRPAGDRPADPRTADHGSADPQVPPEPLRPLWRLLIVGSRYPHPPGVTRCGSTIHSTVGQEERVAGRLLQPQFACAWSASALAHHQPGRHIGTTTASGRREYDGGERHGLSNHVPALGVGARVPITFEVDAV
jgi:hypothetical protein